MDDIGSDSRASSGAQPDGTNQTMISTATATTTSNSTIQIPVSIHDQLRLILQKCCVKQELIQKLGLPFIGIVMALIAAGQGSLLLWIMLNWVIWPFYKMLLQVVGVTLGVALGLGFAAHVYDQLTFWNERHMEQQNYAEDPIRRAASKGGYPAPLRKSQSTIPTMGDDQDYANLLAAAGYVVDRKLLRGHVVRSDAELLLKANYGFDGNNKSPSHACNRLRSLWPTLPEPVVEQLGQFIEYVLRDFVACWYKSVDEGCLYQDAELLRNKQLSGEESNTPAMSQPRYARAMIYTLALHRSSPFLENLYESMAILFGNLATRVEHVNVFSVVLLQWTRILAHTFKVYRALRKSVQNKRLHVSEINMTKEFLFCNKLHRAITFGLDVPSLLFADATGRECGPSGKDDEEVLAKRLFETKLLQECELDYNRVLSNRMVRALTPRNEFGSPIVASLLTEILSGCVLTPLMGCFGPDYINGWIIKGLSPSVSTTTPMPDSTTLSDLETDNPYQDDGLSSYTERLDIETSNPSYSGNQGEATKLYPEQGDLVLRHTEGPTLVNGVQDFTPTLNSANASSIEDNIISLLALALIDLQKYIDFDDFRRARENNAEVKVDWDDHGCRAAVLKLVLVVELALTHGRCVHKIKPTERHESSTQGEKQPLEEKIDRFEDEDDCEEIGEDESEQPVEVTLKDYESATLSQLLMEMTSDIEAFEARVAMENALADESDYAKSDVSALEQYKPNSTEQSTLRTLIAAWLHTGQIYRMVVVLIQAHSTVLMPYYHSNAFLRLRPSAQGFVRQLKALDGVDVMVDTMTVLDCPRLDETNSESLQDLVRKVAISSPSQLRPLPPIGDPVSTQSSARFLVHSSTTPRFIDFHRNESFAASLRSERERRMSSWLSITTDDDGLLTCSRTRGATQEDIALHQELHHIAKIFYTGTNLIAIRDAARRKNSSEGDGSLSTEALDDDDVNVSLITIETACPRRRIEVPDDDSSFLLRAQPRPLNAVGVHRDQRNHDQSFKCFAATYEEFISGTGGVNYYGGRFVRRCLVRYYPSDRTASVLLQNDTRKLDQRKSRVPETITLEQNTRPTPFLSSDFLKERHLCHRFVPRGTSRSQSILSSSVMEPTDFTAVPRPGKAIDFVYRLSFFEKPMVDLGGKYFVVHDAATLGVHRTDASAMELSDASLSVALLMLGSTYGDISTAEDHAPMRQEVHMGKDGYPVIWMKLSRKHDDALVEVKPYRTSFVRAALMITASRQEAQLQCLIKCVRAGSAKSATRALTDAHLKPTLKLLEYASSKSREKQSLLLRDLKLGVNHIDRDQLRRNGLLNPRYPTELLDLSAVVEDVIQTADDRGGDFFGGPVAAYKVRCTATVRVVAIDDDFDGDQGYKTGNRLLDEYYREEWVVYRTFKDFQVLHKHLKMQVAASMSSGIAGSRIVGAATAAFANSAAPQLPQRQPMIPSLSQAAKAGALGATKKSMMKRKDILSGYVDFILSHGNLLNRSVEILLFLGAYYPLPVEIRVGEDSFSTDSDPLGRTEMSRKIFESNTRKSLGTGVNVHVKVVLPTALPSTPNRIATLNDLPSVEEDGEEDLGDRESRRTTKKVDMIPSIREKVEKVPLSLVRNRLFELLKHQFGFENASFIRNRMLAALKTASFAITSAFEFRKTLYNLHVEHLSGHAVAGYIKLGLDLLWPGGVFFSSSPPYSQEQLLAMSAEAKRILHSCFPEQLTAILGQELAQDGLDIFHEMLQNRVVVRSMAYMLFDLLWIEVFPEIGDVLQCGAALDLESQ